MFLIYFAFVTLFYFHNNMYICNANDIVKILLMASESEKVVLKDNF